MRLIGTLPPDQAKTFCLYLKQEKIDSTCEANGEVWIINEDEITKATELFNRFQANPSDPIFRNVTVYPQVEVPSSEYLSSSHARPRRKGPLTTLLILTAIILFFATEWTAPPMPQNPQDIPIPMAYAPPVMQDLLYDFPRTYELASEIYLHFPLDEIQNPQTAPKQLQELLQQLNQSSYWKGAYDEFIQRVKNPSLGWSYTGPWFEKIAQGQWWRTFTPALLHGNLLHILFNLMWIFILSYQVERKIGTIKMFFLVLISGIISNTAEYLMSGPNFLGLSGIVVALAGFIWMRKRIAPWEGYVLHSSTILFLALFVLAMFALQFISFITELFFNFAISPGIANTAHIVGGLVGMGFGALKFYSRKHVR